MEGSGGKVFAQYCAELRRAVNPNDINDIAAGLFAKHVITRDEKAEVDPVMYTTRFRTDKLLMAVHSAISVDDKNFYIFQEVLDAIPKYKSLVRRMKDTLEGSVVEEVFVRYFAELMRAVDPDDIYPELFAKGVITENAVANVDGAMSTDSQRMSKLLAAVKKAIRIREDNFHIFLRVLDAIPKYNFLVRRMKYTLEVPLYHIEVYVAEVSVEEVFVRFYAELMRAVNPDDIAAELFANGVITDKEKAEVDPVMYTVAVRMDKLLQAVQNAVHVDDNNFHIFLEVLYAIPRYVNLVRRMKDTYFQETSPLQVPSPPAITTQPEPLNVQWGSEAVLSCRANGPPGQMVTYQWCKGGKPLPSDSSGDLRIPQVTCEDEGKYNCVVSCGEKKINSDVHVQLEEADCIEITRHPEDVQVRVNATITLSCEARNKAGKELVYEWFMGDKKIGCGPLYQLKAVQRHRKYIKYYCRVSLKDKDKVFIKSNQATITIVSLRFTDQPQIVNEYVGEHAILWCHAENITSPEENITYDWLKSVNKEGPFKVCFGSGEVLVIESLTDKHPGYYKCQALTNDGLITSNIVYVGAKLPGNTNDINLPEICFTKQPFGWAIEPDKSFSLICEATASKGDVTYQWYKDGRFLPNEQKSELRRMSAKLSDFGSYYCLVRTVEGGAVALSDTARVEMKKTEERHYGRNEIADPNIDALRSEHLAQEKVALLIGNGHYNKIPELENVESDIRNLQRALSSLRFKVISLLDLTFEDMIKALQQFYSLLKAGVYAVFYFSGHGFRYNEVTYLMPIDAASNPVMCDSNISAKTIKYNMQETLATGLSLLDCCAVCTNNIQPPRNPTSEFCVSQNLYEISACLEGHYAYMHTFNDALVECLKKKIKLHELSPEIQEIMKKAHPDHPQLPTMTGGVLNKDITLHDPIMFESEDAMKHSDLLRDQANSVPETVVLNVDLGHLGSQVQLHLRFSADFSNVLNVEVSTLPNSYPVNFSVADMCSQGVDVTSEASSCMIKGIQKLKGPLKLHMSVAVTDVIVKRVVHEIKNEGLFRFF